MRIGFYAPMKAPGHPVPSGDRQMARLLMAGLALAGHRVTLLSTLRSFQARPDPAGAAALDRAAAAEVARLAAAWEGSEEPPDLVFVYHLHYKAPDLVGLPLARRAGLPYLTAEASYAGKRDAGPWAARQARVVEAVRSAALNLCFTPADRAGLAALVPPARLWDLPPFVDSARFAAEPPPRGPAGHALVTVAMMRPGDKLASYRFLAEALRALAARPWTLTVVGDGPAAGEAKALLAAAVPPERLRFLGQRDDAGVATALAEADLFLWPGFGEAFGLCYLEAAAAGLPSVAVDNAGVSSVVCGDRTGLLVPPDPALYAAAVATLLDDPGRRHGLGAAALRFVRDERSLAAAALRLDAAVTQAAGPSYQARLAASGTSPAHP